MAVSVLAEALVRWQHAAGPFWPYVCAAPFLGTGEGATLAKRASSTCERLARAHVSDRSGRHAVRTSRRERDLADRLLGSTVSMAAAATDAPSAFRSPEEDSLPNAREPSGAGEGHGAGVSLGRHGREPLTLLLVDLPAEPVLAVAPLLVERGWYVVPVVQRWIASPAVLPCRKLVDRLLVGAWQARRPTFPRGAVLIADGERTGRRGYPATVPGRAFDNRYEYQICRFPSTDFLMAQGVARIQWITTSASPVERPVRPDLAPYLEDLLRAGLAVDVQPWSP